MTSILIAGDYSPMSRVAQLIDRGRADEVFSEVKTLTEKVDYSVVNLECTVAVGGDTPIRKTGPCLNCSADAVNILRTVGFNMVTLANNHFADYGDRAVARSLETIETAGLDHVGGGRNLSDAEQPLYKKIRGETFAFINCCEHEFTIADETHGGSNPLDPVRQYYQIREAKSKADYVVVITHGGHEYFQLPSPRMQETYRFFIDAGADAVVNHHQHCYSGYEFYHGKPIVYGLGNFCFDMGRSGDSSRRQKMWREGYAVQIDFIDRQTALTLHPYTQCDEKPRVSFLTDRAAFDKCINELNAIILDKKKLKSATEAFYNETEKCILDIFEPYTERLHLLGAFRRGLLPSLAFLCGGHALRARNAVWCEAHLDRLRHALDRIINR